MSNDIKEQYRQCLWKTKRSLEDIPWDDTIDHYVISPEKYDILVGRINKILKMKPMSSKRIDRNYQD